MNPGLIGPQSSVIGTPLILSSLVQALGLGEGTVFVRCYLVRTLCWEIQELP